MECYCCEMSKTSWQMGKLTMKDSLENHSKGQYFLLELWLNITRFQHEINQDFINLARKFYLECSSYLQKTREFGSGDLLVADIEELENMEASEVHPRRINAKEVLTPQRSEHFSISQLQMEQQKCQEETTNSENPLQGGNNL